MVRELTKNQRKKALKELKMLNGLPPYDGGDNICLGDAYFGRSIRHYGMTTEELGEACGFDKIYEEWEKQRESFIKIQVT